MQIKEIVNGLVIKAIELHASDLFFMPQEDQAIVNVRTQSGLICLTSFTLEEVGEIISFFKYAAQMDISEHRRPQVGAMNFTWEDKDYDLRLSSVGDYKEHESLVVRIIYNLGESQYFLPKQLIQLTDLSFKRGLIITSGPTGSGKTTTMYELAKKVGKNKFVMTIEDPVEVREENFLQTQVNDDADISYVALLKAALRHRPDILIIGEIRDSGTARLAIDAALSGHLVLATIHAKSTLQTISRLESLGIRQNELLNCLTAISYQRLLPTKKGLACLLDIASKKDLQEEIELDKRLDFINWQDNLKYLLKKGEITDEICSAFWEG